MVKHTQTIRRYFLFFLSVFDHLGGGGWRLKG